MTPTLVKATFFLTLSGALALVSCQSEKEETSTKTEEEEEHSTSWTPTDPSLIAGQKVYETECSLCHDEGEEGAPRLSKKETWEKREAKGLATLLDHAINGYDGPNGEMPARGGTPTLTDEEVTNAVKYMLAIPK